MSTLQLCVGDQVTCLHAVQSYCQQSWFQPGMLGTVAGIVPKVRIVHFRDDPRYDGRQNFVVVDYVDEAGQKRRTGLNFCNVRKCGPGDRKRKKRG